MTSATRPLLRQIENLQANLGAQTTSWEKLEKSISDRLGKNISIKVRTSPILPSFCRSDYDDSRLIAEAQAQLAVAVEKERSTTDELNGIRAQLASLESQNSLLRQEKGRLQGQLDVEKTRRENLENDSSR